jgi:hypothetical protein
MRQCSVCLCGGGFVKGEPIFLRRIQTAPYDLLGQRPDSQFSVSRLPNKQADFGAGVLEML